MVYQLNQKIIEIERGRLYNFVKNRKNRSAIYEQIGQVVHIQRKHIQLHCLDFDVIVSGRGNDNNILDA